MKTKQVNIRMTQQEYQEITQKASNFGLTISRYLRDLSLNYPITCIADQKTAHNLLQIAGDLGRLGGLFKLWLMNNEKDKPNFSENRTYNDIEEVLSKILELQDVMKQQALKIIKECN